MMEKNLCQIVSLRMKLNLIILPSKATMCDLSQSRVSFELPSYFLVLCTRNQNKCIVRGFFI
uniref:Uncharacterized protein n=1 Tax=Rhizophora mucronata TaxID=61149 RepID=A0A2P2QTE1_RHIMU